MKALNEIRKIIWFLMIAISFNLEAFMTDMTNENRYAAAAGEAHIKKHSQFFTNKIIADFMARSVAKNARRVLDPAVGNSVFFSAVRRYNSSCVLIGYEVDNIALDFFGNPTKATIYNDDYLLKGWGEKYDAIICNPPYKKFQTVSNRDVIIENVFKHTGIRCSGYTNLYLYFLLKSIYELDEQGCLAYIVPSEFLNARYGIPIKEFLLRENLISAIVNLENDKGLFSNALTTSCILFLDKRHKDSVRFYNIENVADLQALDMEDDNGNFLDVAYRDLSASEKWRRYLGNEKNLRYANTIEISTFCKAARGIATGDNEFFCFSLPKAKELKIPIKYLEPCVCHSVDINTTIFGAAEMNRLVAGGKLAYLLNVVDTNCENVVRYITSGEEKGINKKYLLSHRRPWYAIEKKEKAPIWMTTACRDGVKFVRNVADVNTLTTFHSIYIKDTYAEDTNLIFCYFQTQIAQELLRRNRKEMGSGLEKFQPNDFNSAEMLDIRVITKADREEVLKLYSNINGKITDDQKEYLNEIFSKYVSTMD